MRGRRSRQTEARPPPSAREARGEREGGACPPGGEASRGRGGREDGFCARSGATDFAAGIRRRGTRAQGWARVCVTLCLLRHSAPIVRPVSGGGGCREGVPCHGTGARLMSICCNYDQGRYASPPYGRGCGWLRQPKMPPLNERGHCVGASAKPLCCSV